MKTLNAQEEDSSGNSGQVSMTVNKDENSWNESSDDFNGHNKDPWSQEIVIVGTESNEKDNGSNDQSNVKAEVGGQSNPSH